MKTPIVLGRALNERDNIDRPKVAVINEAMVRVYFPGGSPTRPHFQRGRQGGMAKIQVVGSPKMPNT